MADNVKSRPLRPMRTVLSDETYLRIREMLLTHDIAPGERINIDALARELDVSQTPVREALARLESEDLVTKEPLRGYTATKLLTVPEIQDLFQFRGLIEPWAAGMAARNINEEGIARLQAELAKGQSAENLDIDEAYAAMSEHDARFHALIAELSGSEFVHDAYVRTHCHLHLFPSLHSAQDLDGTSARRRRSHRRAFRAVLPTQIWLPGLQGAPSNR